MSLVVLLDRCICTASVLIAIGAFPTSTRCWSCTSVADSSLVRLCISSMRSVILIDGPHAVPL